MYRTPAHLSSLSGKNVCKERSEMRSEWKWRIWGANSCSCSQWVLFPNCTISCMYCSWAGTTTHFSFKEEERMNEVSGSHSSLGELCSAPEPHSSSPTCLPQSRALLRPAPWPCPPGWTGCLSSPSVPAQSPGFPGKWLPWWSLNVPCWWHFSIALAVCYPVSNFSQFL